MIAGPLIAGLFLRGQGHIDVKVLLNNTYLICATSYVYG